MLTFEAHFEENIFNHGTKNMPLESTYQKIKNENKYCCDDHGTGIQMSLGPPVLEDETKFKYENVDVDLDPPELELCDYAKFKKEVDVSGEQIQSDVLWKSNKISHVSKELCVKLFKQILMPKRLRVHLQKFVFPRNLSCPKCPYQAKNKPCYHSHMHAHNKKYETCSACQKVVDVRFFRTHMLTHTASIDDKLKCPKCSYTSLYPTNMSRHQKIHGGEHQKCKRCPECAYMTNASGNLKRHYAAMHSPDSNYTCELCGFTSKHKSSWQLHMSTQHVQYSQRKKFECSSCPLLFLTARGLRLHVSLHHKQRDEVTIFKCMHCPYSSVHKQVLQRHIKTRHEAKGFKFQTLFRCVSCKFEIDKESNMEHHIQQCHQNDPDECEYEVYEVPRV